MDFFQNHFAIPYKTQVTVFQPSRLKSVLQNFFVQIYQKTDKKLKKIERLFLPWTQNSTFSLQPCFSCQILTFGGRHSYLIGTFDKENIQVLCKKVGRLISQSPITHFLKKSFETGRIPIIEGFRQVLTKLVLFS